MKIEELISDHWYWVIGCGPLRFHAHPVAKQPRRPDPDPTIVLEMFSRAGYRYWADLKQLLYEMTPDYWATYREQYESRFKGPYHWPPEAEPVTKLEREKEEE